MGKTVAIANSDMFAEVDGAKALISARGVWMQTGVYQRNSMLFVAYGKGFVRLLSRNLTTVPHVKWEAIEGVTCPHCSEVLPDVDPDEVEVVSGDEVFDLIAEAARTSPHAARAYRLIRQANPAILPLERRQELIKHRMAGVPL
jgi:hypothetical protein